MKNFLLLTFILSLIACRGARNWVVDSPAGDRYCTIDPKGESIIPNGRIIKPMGRTVRIAPHPYGLALSRDGRVAVTANSGNRPFSITILDQLESAQPRVRQIPEGAGNNDNLLEDVFMGLAITPDDRQVWVAGGKANKVFLFDLGTGAKLDSINCAQADNPDGYLGDLALTRDGNRLYICDQSNFRLIIADTRQRKVLYYVPVGRYPFGVCLSPDEKTAYVANVGMVGRRERDAAARDASDQNRFFGR